MQTNLQRLKIYLDTCCLNRPFDNQTQTRIRRETEVIRWIIPQFQIGYWHWISSEILIDEIDRISDLNQRFEIKDRLADAHQTVPLRASEISRGKQLEELGFKESDALHLACAESGAADIFLTTDDGLLKRAEGNSLHLHVQVENLYTWFQEITGNERIRDDR